MTLKKGNKIILTKSLTYFYSFIENKNKLILVLSNQSEFLNLKNSVLYFFNQKKLNENNKNLNDIFYNNNDNSFFESYSLVKKNYIPMIKGFSLNLLNHLENISPIFIKLIEHFPYNKDIGLIKFSYPSQINSEVLNVQNYDSYVLSSYKNNSIENLIDNFHFGDKNNFKKVESLYKSKILDKNIKLNKINKKDCIIITHKFFYLKENSIESEIISIPRRLFHICIALESLKKGGNLYYPFTSIVTEASLQMLSELSILFKSYKFVETNFEFSIEGYFIFNDYSGSHKFTSLYEQVYNREESLGESFLFNSEEYNLFNFGTKINNEFLEFYKLNLDLEIAKKNKLIKKIEYIENIFNLDYKKKQIIDDQISFAIDFCNNFDLKINKYFKKYFFKLNKLELKKKYFPNFNNVDFSKLKLDFTSLYSVSFPKESEILSNLIKERFPNLKSIADMCSNVGGNTISFCKNFDYVYSIELNKDIFKMLKNNIEAYNFKNYKLLNIDSNNFTENVDLYFYDPPWSGIYYKINTNIDLFLSKKNIIDVIKNNFCLKVPNNYNFTDLIKKFNNLEVISLRSYVIIFNKIY